ncbi:hypothetical protein ACFFSQ_06190 [Dactylosporangium matsuzakiense]|uniref:hypothetical protein n=1 Tax=Dactylosporangium matsuzakiense TaxID=53360 RepID=UPI0035EE7AE7
MKDEHGWTASFRKLMADTDFARSLRANMLASIDTRSLFAGLDSDAARKALAAATASIDTRPLLAGLDSDAARKALAAATASIDKSAVLAMSDVVRAAVANIGKFHSAEDNRLNSNSAKQPYFVVAPAVKQAVIDNATEADHSLRAEDIDAEFESLVRELEAAQTGDSDLATGESELTSKSTPETRRLSAQQAFVVRYTFVSYITIAIALHASNIAEHFGGEFDLHQFITDQATAISIAIGMPGFLAFILKLRDDQEKN